MYTILSICTSDGTYDLSSCSYVVDTQNNNQVNIIMDIYKQGDSMYPLPVPDGTIWRPSVSIEPVLSKVPYDEYQRLHTVPNSKIYQFDLKRFILYNKYTNCTEKIPSGRVIK